MPAPNTEYRVGPRTLPAAIDFVVDLNPSAETWNEKTLRKLLITEYSCGENNLFASYRSRRCHTLSNASCILRKAANTYFFYSIASRAKLTTTLCSCLVVKGGA